MARWELDSEHRLRTLEETGILPGLSDDAFDAYTGLVSRLLDVPVALVSLVNGDCQYFPAAVGLDEPWATEKQTPLSMSFCKHVVVNDDVLRVTDARIDERVRDNPSVSELSVVAYLGVPLRAPGGEPLGSLCAIDDRPRQWTEDDVRLLREIADAAAALIALRTAEQQQRERAARASHDLRTPLAAARLKLEDLAAWPSVTDDVREILGDVVGDIEHLSRLVDGLVADAQMGVRARDADADLVAIAHDLVADWRERLAHVHRLVAIEAEGAALVAADRATLRFALDAFVADVVDRGSGSITVRVVADAAAARLQVIDDELLVMAHGDESANLVRLADRVGAHVRPLPRPLAGYELVFRHHDAG